MRRPLAVRALTTFLMMAILFGSFSTDLIAQSLETTTIVDSLTAQVGSIPRSPRTRSVRLASGIA